MPSTININDTVWVRLTDAGREEFANQGTQTRASLEFTGQAAGVHSIPLTVDEIDGWSEWTFWELMQTFGHQLYNGQPNPPFEMEIALENPITPAPSL